MELQAIILIRFQTLWVNLLKQVSSTWKPIQYFGLIDDVKQIYLILD